LQLTPASRPAHASTAACGGMWTRPQMSVLPSRAVSQTTPYDPSRSTGRRRGPRAPDAQSPRPPPRRGHPGGGRNSGGAEGARGRLREGAFRAMNGGQAD
jgi:hypothetical protein